MCAYTVATKVRSRQNERHRTTLNSRSGPSDEYDGQQPAKIGQWRSNSAKLTIYSPDIL
jgi:hypothetical protein